MKTLELTKATDPLAHYARHLHKEPMILTTHGKHFAALILIPNADRETVSLSTNPRFLAMIERSRARHKREGGVSSDEVRRLFDIPEKRRVRKRTNGTSSSPTARSISSRGPRA